jgi:multidrug resistance efflux pump
MSQTSPPLSAPPGFPRQPSLISQGPVARPTPLPRRPKGRWFIGLLLLGACVFVGLEVRETFFRYRAYGTIAGQVVQLPAPWDGSVRQFHVREGDSVRQGQLLVTLENPDLRRRHAQLEDEIQIAQATLEAEAARLKWQVAFHLDHAQGAVARQQESWGELVQAQAQLDKLKSELRTAEPLVAPGVVPRQEYLRLLHDTQGLQQKVEKMQAAQAERHKHVALTTGLLEKSGELSTNLMQDGKDQLKPFLARIASLQAERRRLEERLAEGRLAAPANGLVVKVQRLSGESCRAGETVLSLLEEGSLQIVLFVPQKASSALTVGAAADLVVEPYPESLQATVVRLGDQYEAAPEQLKRHYPQGQKLLPVYLTPASEAARWMALRVGSVVKFP